MIGSRHVIPPSSKKVDKSDPINYNPIITDMHYVQIDGAYHCTQPVEKTILYDPPPTPNMDSEKGGPLKPSF